MSLRVWLSYDLGLKGNYDALYTWLAKKKAGECGDSIATFLLDSDTKDPGEEIVNDLKGAEILGQRDRLYLVWKGKEDKKIHGKFIYGSRKTPPWSGYGTSEDKEDEE